MGGGGGAAASASSLLASDVSTSTLSYEFKSDSLLFDKFEPKLVLFKTFSELDAMEIFTAGRGLLLSLRIEISEELFRPLIFEFRALSAAKFEELFVGRVK